MEASQTEKSHYKFLHLSGKLAGQEILVSKETFFIGRSRNNHLVLEDRSVSRKHAVLNLVDGNYILSDLNSYRGTFVNGQQIQEIILKDGDRVNIGTINLEFKNVVGSEVFEKKKPPILLISIIIGAVVLITVGIFILLGGKDRSVPVETAREVEYNYSQGVKAYNIDKDIETARRYWQRVLELDPLGNSSTTKKVKTLLESLPDNSGGDTNR